MRRLSAAVVLVLLLSRPASAQAPPARPPPISPAAVELNAQSSIDAAYLLAQYMAYLASAGMPPSPSDIDEATRQYLTNGAAVTGVPTQGPAAAYFQNGAAVTGAPASGPGADYFHNGSQVLAYYPAPQPVAPAATAQPAVAAELDAGMVADSAEDAGVPEAPEEAGAAPLAPTPTETAPTPASTSSVPVSPPVETPAVQSEAMPAPPLVASSCPPCGVASATEAPAAAPQCPPATSRLSRIATALGGALGGGLAVVLWTRPRSPRPRRHPGKERAHAK